MSMSMYWLSARLAGCPDAAGLEYGCVDWFRYGEGAPAPRKAGDRSAIARRATGSRLRCRVVARSAALTASEQPADTQ